MQSITSSLSSFFLDGPTTAAGNAITDFLSNFQTAVQTKFKLEKRNAVRYINQAGHRFVTILLTEPTCCSNCGKLILGLWGFTCRSCNLSVCRKKCLHEIAGRCVKDQQLINESEAGKILIESSQAAAATRLRADDHLTHRFVLKTFKTPTTCKHCGTFLIGFSEQGLECAARECKMTVHSKCKQLVCTHCQSSRSSSTIKLGASSSVLQDTCEQDQRRQQATTSQQMSKIQIEDFDVIRLIGTGSFSKVYLAKLRATEAGNATPRDLERLEFAIKVIKKTNPVIASDPHSVFSERATLRLGKTYPFLAVVHCCFQSPERLYLVMEHVVGIDFVHYLSRVRKFKEDQARFYAAEIALALMFLHSEQIVYRDLKLDNVILDRTGHCKLIDFGMSKELSQTSTNKTRTFCGTPSYISPEIILEHDYDYSVDWWSFGVLLYEMLVGHSPFDAYTEDDIYRLILREEARIPEYLSLEAKSILCGLLTKEPQYRLGCQIMEDRHVAVKEHPFFMFTTARSGSKSHRWHEIENKKMEPPFKPTEDMFLFPGEDVEQDQLAMSPVSRSQLKRISQDDYHGFSFYSDSFRSLSCLNLT